jgi:DNA repair ATPase RecN
MLTRLKVSGFKNLVDVDVSFGPFTCIAGANGVGKSNLFDAIHFLSALADVALMEAALSVRHDATFCLFTLAGRPKLQRPLSASCTSNRGLPHIHSAFSSRLTVSLRPSLNYKSNARF